MKKLTISIGGAVAIAATIVTWLGPDDLYIRDRIIITLSVAVVCLIYIYIELRKRHKELASNHAKLSQKHKALSRQFEGKQQTIKEYEHAESSIMQLFGMAMQTKKEQKFDVLAEGIAFHFKKINKDRE